MESSGYRNIKLYYCLDNKIDPKSSIVKNFLLPQELGRAARFLSEFDRGIYMISHAFLNASVSEILKIEPAQIAYQKNNFGKPYVESKKFYFSLSHSKNSWCLAVSGHNVGVDLEEINRNYNYSDILERFFSEKERQAIIQAEDPHTEFYKFWTRKEALLKAAGTGLVDNLEKIEVLKSTLVHQNSSYFLYSTTIRNSSLALATSANLPVEYIEITSQNYFTFFPARGQNTA